MEGRLERALQTVPLAALCGFAVGVVVGGIGSRVAMRVTALMASDVQQGAITDAEAVVGEITADGTIGLMLFGGGLGGIFGGLVYLAMRSWLAGAGRLRGLAFGLTLLASFGWLVIEGDNPDFARFGDTTVNVAMFASLFLLFGLAIAPLFDWAEARLRRGSLSQIGPGAMVAYGLGWLMVVPMLPLLLFGLDQDSATRAALYVGLPAYALLALPPLGMWASGGGFERLSDLRGRPHLLALAAIAPVLVVGWALTADALALIY